MYLARAYSLEQGLQELGVTVTVAHSEAEFQAAAAHMASFDLIFLDPWTNAGKGTDPGTCRLW